MKNKKYNHFGFFSDGVNNGRGIFEHRFFSIFIILLLICCLSLLPGCSSKKATQKSAKGNKSTKAVIKYDKLQKLFLTINSKTKESDIKKYIKEKSLKYGEDVNNTDDAGEVVTYTIAYTDGAAASKYADPGDSLEVEFNKDNGKIQYAYYVKENKDNSALYFYYGTWFDFIEDKPSDKTGYYSIDSIGDSHKCKDAKEAINKVIKTK